MLFDNTSLQDKAPLEITAKTEGVSQNSLAFWNAVAALKKKTQEEQNIAIGHISMFGRKMPKAVGNGEGYSQAPSGGGGIFGGGDGGGGIGSGA
jgi:hypothetical protein